MIKNGHKINEKDLRDYLVTQNTKKTSEHYKDFINQKKIVKNYKDPEKLVEQQKLKTIKDKITSINNPNCKEWTLNVPKEIRANSIRDLCKNYKTAFSNLKGKNINRFEMKFRKKSFNRQYLSIQKNLLKLTNNNIIIAPTYFKDFKVFNIGPKLLKDLKKNNINSIDSDTRLIKHNGQYHLYLSIKYTPISTNSELNNSFIGIDLGVRSLGTVYGSETAKYKFDNSKIDRIDKVISKLKSLRTCFGIKPVNKHKRIRKKFFYKRERLKKHLIDELHWIFIKDILKHSTIFLGDIKSHNIVKDNTNSTLNTDFNNLKFFQLKQKLLYKSEKLGKKVYSIPEHYTTQTCSSCGILNQIGSSKVYNCSSCKSIFDRDQNSAKNILMKGLILNKFKF